MKKKEDLCNFFIYPTYIVIHCFVVHFFHLATLGALAGSRPIRENGRNGANWKEGILLVITPHVSSCIIVIIIISRALGAFGVYVYKYKYLLEYSVHTMSRTHPKNTIRLQPSLSTQNKHARDIDGRRSNCETQGLGGGADLISEPTNHPQREDLFPGRYLLLHVLRKDVGCIVSHKRSNRPNMRKKHLFILLDGLYVRISFLFAPPLLPRVD